MFLLFALLPSAHAFDTLALGLSGTIASDNAAFLLAPEELWFRTNGGPALTLELGNRSSNASLAVRSGWHYRDGLTFEVHCRAASQTNLLGGRLILMGEFPGIQFGSGLLSVEGERRILVTESLGVGLSLSDNFTIATLGSLGLGAAMEKDERWYITNSWQATVEASWRIRL